MNPKYNLNLDQDSDDSDVLNSKTQGLSGLSSNDLQKVSSSKSDNTDNSNNDDYSSLAKQDLLNSKTQGITKDQLDALHKHEAANTWTSLFMNMIGAANGIKDGSKFAEPLNRQVEQERQGLSMQQQLANQQAERAAQEQRMGLSDVELSQRSRQNEFAQKPISPIQQGAILAYAKQTGQTIDPNQLNNITQEQYESFMSPLKDAGNLNIKQKQIDAANQFKLLQLQNQELGNQLKGIEKIPVKNPDGSIGYEFANKLTNSGVPLENTIVPQMIKSNQQQAQNFSKLVAPSIETHRAIQNYDTALQGLNPTEAQQADDLARRQVSAIAGKFDQGVKANIITNANQLLNTIAKMEQTSEFNTPNNPAIGQAAFRRVKSALEFAAATQAGKTRPSNFATQFSLGNSFGSNIAGQPVPQEKIDELKQEASQGIGGNLQTAISAMPDEKFGRQKAKEIFGDSADDYLNSFHNIRGPGVKDTNKKENINIPQHQTLEDYLSQRGR